MFGDLPMLGSLSDPAVLVDIVCGIPDRISIVVSLRIRFGSVGWSHKPQLPMVGLIESLSPVLPVVDIVELRKVTGPDVVDILIRLVAKFEEV
jgi:hypothetical protein